MTVLLTLHSIVRWLVILVSVAALVKFISGLVGKQAYDKAAKGLTAAFSGLMDLQGLLGILFFVINGAAIEGGFALRHRWEHLVIMALAITVAHFPSMRKTETDDGKRYRNALIAVVGALILIAIGVTLLPGNRWLTITGLF